jgi:hypothetical protein
MIIGRQRGLLAPPGNFPRCSGVGMSDLPRSRSPMLVALLRLFALRPLLTFAIFGIPLFVLVMVGLFTILALKLLVFVVLPIVAVVWLVRRLTRSGDSPAL